MCNKWLRKDYGILVVVDDQHYEECGTYFVIISRLFSLCYDTNSGFYRYKYR